MNIMPFEEIFFYYIYKLFSFSISQLLETERVLFAESFKIS